VGREKSMCVGVDVGFEDEAEGDDESSDDDHVQKVVQRGNT